MRYVNMTEAEVRRMNFFNNLKGFYKWVIFVIWLFLWFMVSGGIHRIAVDSHLYQNSFVAICGSVLGGLVLTFPFNLLRTDAMTVISWEVIFLWEGTIIFVIISALVSILSVLFS